jgi:hypothetical protein
LTDWRYCYATNVTPTGCIINTYIYKIPNNGPRQWFPAGEVGDMFSFSFSVLGVAPIPDMTRSYYVPETGSIASPSNGLSSPTSFSMFRGCPNNDGASLPNNARVKVVVKDALGNGIPDIVPGDILVLFNGGTRIQGFVGDGADSVIANAQYNPFYHCPDVRALYADSTTTSSGVTYITFRGSSSPGVSTRDPNRKWGHYDTDLGVYVVGKRLQGRLSDASSPNSYRLQLKSVDVTGGTTILLDSGELVNSADFGIVAAHIGQHYGDFWLNWWLDFNSDGIITSADMSILSPHIDHVCDWPTNP